MRPFLIAFAYEPHGGWFVMGIDRGWEDIPLQGSRKHPSGQDCYSQLAARTHHEGFRLYRLRPKLRMFWELSRLDGVSLSPLCMACWSDEDFIGRISRISRRCHGATATISTIRRSLGMYKTLLDKFATKKRSGRRG